MISVNKQKWESNFNLAPQVIQNELKDFMDLRGSKIVDFGCGLGIKTLGVAHHFLPEKITGIDVIDKFNDVEENAIQVGGIKELPSSLDFVKINPGQPADIGYKPDCIFSWSVFEHIRFDLLPGVFNDHFNLLNDNGLIFLQINPLYFSPYGSHLGSWIQEPWAHLRYQTNVLQKMLYNSSQDSDLAGILAQSSDNEKSYKEKPGPWSCYRTLNRVTISQLKKIAENAGFEIIKEVISRSELVPDESLLEIYHEDVLLAEGVRLVMKKS